MNVLSSENTPQQENVQQKETATAETPKQDQQINNEPVSGTNEATEDKDPNFRAFREARKQDREARRAAEQLAAEKAAEAAALKAAMEAAFAKSSSQPVHADVADQYGYVHTEESEDERIEKKIQAAIAKREHQFMQEAAQREQEEYPQRLRQNYPDFGQVIAQENLDYIDYHYPEISRSLQRLPEDYNKWSDIYHTVKRLVPNHGAAKKDAARADANMIKPKSISSTGITQPGEAKASHILTEEKRAANWARMQATMKGLS